MSFGVPTSFGLFQTKPMFGQTTSPSGQTSIFGGNTSSGFGTGVFGPTQTTSPMFGQTNTSAGQTMFGVPINNTSSVNNSPFAGGSSSGFGTGAGIWQTSNTMTINEHDSPADKIASISSVYNNKSHEELRSENYGNAKGSRRSPYASTPDWEEVKGTKVPIKIQSISAMPIYKNISHEELRIEDYEERAKGVQTPWANKPSEPSVAPNTPTYQPSPFTFNTPSTNPFSASTNPFTPQPQFPTTTTTSTPSISPNPFYQKNIPSTTQPTNPFSPITNPFGPQPQTPTATPTPPPSFSPSPFSAKNNPFTTTQPTSPLFPSPNLFAPQSKTPITNNTTSPSPYNPFATTQPTSPLFPSPNLFAPQSKTPITNNTTSPSPYNPFATTQPTSPLSPSTNLFAPQSQTPTTNTTTPTPSPYNPFTTTQPTSPLFPSTNLFVPKSQTPTTNTTTPAPSPYNPFTPTQSTSPLFPSTNLFVPKSQTHTTNTTTPTPSPYNPFTTTQPTNPLFPPTNLFDPKSQIPTTNTTPNPSTSPSSYNPFATTKPTNLVFPSINPANTTTPTVTTQPQPFTIPNNSVIRASTPAMTSDSIFHDNTTNIFGHPEVTCTTIPSQPLQVFTSIVQPEALTSTPRGISSLPVKNNSAPVRLPSSYRIRHLSSRRVSLPANRYKPESSVSKVPFFDDKEYKPCLAAPFVPRENPRACLVNEPKHAPIDTNEEGETREEKAGTKSCFQVNENSVKVINNDPLDSSLLPKLPCVGEYFTEPSIKELERKERAEPGFCSRVKNFVVGRKDKGSIEFLGETDIRHLDLESIVQFNDREVIVYKDEENKPPVGQGLNRPAEVTLLNIKFLSKTSRKQFSDGHQVQKMEKLLMKKTNEQGAEFVSYNSVRGEWKFRVQHF